MNNNQTVGQQVGYTRVSSAGQVDSRQLADMKLDRVFSDIITGSSKVRPALDECLLYCRCTDVLHIHSIDRMARSLVHLLDILDQFLSKGVTVWFHKENLVFSGKDSPTSKLMLQIIGAVAEWERSMIRERQAEGIAISKIKGTKSGKPFGKTPLDMNLRPQAIELSKAGNNISQIARAMSLSRASIYKLLS